MWSLLGSVFCIFIAVKRVCKIIDIQYDYSEFNLIMHLNQF